MPNNPLKFGDDKQAIKDYVFKRLVDGGFTEIAAKAFLVNLAYESGNFNSIEELQTNKLGTKGLGLAQWTGVRRDYFEKWLKENSKDVNSIADNMDYFLKEFELHPDSTGGTIDSYNNSIKNEADGVFHVLNKYEVPEIRTKEAAKQRMKSFNAMNLDMTISIPDTPDTPDTPEIPKTFDEIHKARYQKALDSAKGKLSQKDKAKLFVKTSKDLKAELSNAQKELLDFNKKYPLNDQASIDAKKQLQSKYGLEVLKVAENQYNEYVDKKNKVLDTKVGSLSSLETKLKEIEDKTTKAELIKSNSKGFVERWADAVYLHPDQNSSLSKNKEYQILLKQKNELLKDINQQVGLSDYKRLTEIINNSSVGSPEYNNAKKQFEQLADNSNFKSSPYLHPRGIAEIKNASDYKTYTDKQKESKLNFVPVIEEKKPVVSPSDNPDGSKNKNNEVVTPKVETDDEKKAKLKAIEDENKIREDLFFKNSEVPIAEKNRDLPSDFKKPIPLDAIASGLLGIQALAESKVSIPKREEQIQQSVLNFIAEQKKLSEIGLRPEEELAAKQNIADAYQTGIENITRASGGNRNLLLGNLANLDSSRLHSLTQLAVADAEAKNNALANYGKGVQYISDFYANRDIANQQIAMDEAKSKRLAAGQLAAGSFQNMISSIEDAKQNGPGSFNFLYRNAVLNQINGNNNSKASIARQDQLLETQKTVLREYEKQTAFNKQQQNYFNLYTPEQRRIILDRLDGKDISSFYNQNSVGTGSIFENILNEQRKPVNTLIKNESLPYSPIDNLPSNPSVLNYATEQLSNLPFNILQPFGKNIIPEIPEDISKLYTQKI